MPPIAFRKRTPTHTPTITTPAGENHCRTPAAGNASPALERYREERAKLARLDRLEREGKLLARDRMHEGLGQIVSIVREALEILQRQFGAEAHALVDEALDDAERAIGALFEHEHGSGSDA